METLSGHTAPEPARDPIAAYVDRVKEEIIDGVVARLQPLHSEPDLASLGLDPLRAYSAKEVAELLGTRRLASIYEIPEDELPRVRRIGRAVGFLGINVLCYMHGLAPVDVPGAIETFRERLMQERRPTVRPLHPRKEDKTRIL